jgi:hypothetical protein
MFKTGVNNVMGHLKLSESTKRFDIDMTTSDINLILHIDLQFTK